ncbi:DUF6339 family protein [Nocardia transvalensis]|uniref:DUF6339 family protein n=1 Tax=Nocardia transvalensis TaxID=37333 RepID=UPI001893673A|nr:DUF6339 family protein [Nocardia transvalensis]MBF6329226.1 hypothetical protein [Nocardia transvalensis]
MKVDFPEILGLLPNLVVPRYLTAGVQAGLELPPQVPLRKASTLLPISEARWRSMPVRELVDEAMCRFDPGSAKVDAWLSPRLHATLRMTRSEAADSQLWNYLGLLVAPDYVVWRHKSKNHKSGAEEAPVSRFSGPYHTQAFSRLWWMSELFRDGPDYRTVETAFVYQEVANSVLRSSIVNHRPTALAFMRVIEQAMASDTEAIGDYITPYLRAVNAAASTIIYDYLAPDNSIDDGALIDWIGESEYMAPVAWGALPVGPDEGAVSEDAIQALLPLFTEIFSGVERRERSKKISKGSMS